MATTKKSIAIGLVLAVSFWAVLFLIFSPIFGDGKNGLMFADDLFNKLAKGSSNFIEKVAKSNEKFIGKEFSATLKLDKQEQVEGAIKVLTVSGAKVEASEMELKVSGDLGGLLSIILKDSDNMYRNDGKTVSDLYGMDEKEVMQAWWNILKPLDKYFKKAGMIPESKVVSDVAKKAIEPAYNFYKIPAQKVSEKAVLMTGLLVFYVAYTLWWGFAIYFIFNGIGLSMKKAKVKKEI